VEFLLRKRQCQAEPPSLKRLVFSREWRKTRAIEERVCKSFDHILTVSREDKDTLQREFSVANASTIPTGVDTDYFRPVDTPAQPGRLVFVGSMDWYPNDQGIVWFIQEIYARIRKAVPYATLSVVGGNPSRRLRDIAASQAGIDITGRVADVRPHLAAAEVVVVPLQVGGGTRIKIPEAMAMGKAVVSTRIGAEGLSVARHEIRLADDPADFASAVTELLGGCEQRQRLAASARQKAVREYGWDSVVDRVEEILFQVARPASEGQLTVTQLSA
jgi:glycosyltransferase involved in cell wall biosynthesis